MEMKQHFHFSRWMNWPWEQKKHGEISLRLQHRPTGHRQPRPKQTVQHVTVAILVHIFWVFRFDCLFLFSFSFLNLKPFLLSVIRNFTAFVKKFKLLFAFRLALESFIFFWYEWNRLPQSQQSGKQYLKSWVLSFSGNSYA